MSDNFITLNSPSPNEEKRMDPTDDSDGNTDSRNPCAATSANNPFRQATLVESGSPGSPSKNIKTPPTTTSEVFADTQGPIIKLKPIDRDGSPDTMSEIARCKIGTKSNFQAYSCSLKNKIKKMKSTLPADQSNILHEMNVLMEQAWAVPIHGRDLAYGLCDIIRLDGALEIIVGNCASRNRDILRASAKLLEQILTTGNRHKVSKSGLETVVKMTIYAKQDFDMARITTGILESLFKTSEETCTRVIQLGGLSTIIHWCRYSDTQTLRHCAIALANLSLYGGPDNQCEMTKQKAPEWLFPLVFSSDDSVRYYACLAISVLVSNKEIEQTVANSGTLELVLPFIQNHRPSEFAQMDFSHRHGRSQGWLKRLVPLLSSTRQEPQALAAFHFGMEAGIKAGQDRLQVFYEIGCVTPLKKLAGSPNPIASKLAADTLKVIGEDVPHKLTQQVPLWTHTDVLHWLDQVGFTEFKDKFQECRVDGDILLRLVQDELASSLHMECGLMRKRFLRDLDNLKVTCDYTSCDPTNLDDLLAEISPDFSQYTYKMLQAGVDRTILPDITDVHLRTDCGVTNGIHRLKIMQRVDAIKSGKSWGRDSMDGGLFNRPLSDVFISYRRSNGSQLASLLKVHLQLRGYTVFLDIDKLPAGKFDESLLQNVQMAKNFIIVLTANSLDRCMGDAEKKDWVHKEIVAALDTNCNIIPLMDQFEWPKIDSLPDDMRKIAFYNGIKWIHDYQDACVDKLERFLRGEVNTQKAHRGCLQAMSSMGSMDAPRQPFRWSSIDTGSNTTSPSDGSS